MLTTTKQEEITVRMLAGDVRKATSYTSSFCNLGMALKRTLKDPEARCSWGFGSSGGLQIRANGKVYHAPGINSTSYSRKDYENDKQFVSDKSVTDDTEMLSFTIKEVV